MATDASARHGATATATNDNNGSGGSAHADDKASGANSRSHAQEAHRRVQAGVRSVPRDSGADAAGASGSGADARESRVYMCGYSDEPILREPFPDESFSPRTSFELFQRGVRVTGGSARCLGYRESLPDGPYRWLSYREVYARVVALGDALVRHVGLAAGDHVGIYARNMKEWMMTQLACSSRGLVPVPVYDSVGADAAEYIVEHSGMRALFTSVENLPKAASAARGAAHDVHVFVLNASHGANDGSGGGGGGGSGNDHDQSPSPDDYESFDSLVAHGDRNASVPPSTGETLSSLAVIMYTSGTTGTPKGVMLKNEALVSELAALERVTEAYDLKLSQSDVLLSYLPLAHIFEQAVEMLWLVNGASIGYYSGDTKRVLDDVMAVQPTVFVGVPRVFSRIQDRASSTVSKAGFLKRWLFRRAFAAQSAAVRRDGARFRLWDALVFNKLRARLFPRVRFFFSGAAPLPAHTNVFLRTVFGVPAIQGYGLTETTAGAFVAAPGDAFDSVGCVMPCAEFKLVDIDEMQYTHRDAPCPRGELCVRGPAVTHGFYRNDKATREAFPAGDGWFATGDVGRLNEDQTLSVIDRKKNIFKLAQGEYVAVEPLEAEYLKTPGVGQMWIYGDSEQTQIVAIVTPDPDQLREVNLLGKDETVGALSTERTRELRSHLLDRMQAQAKTSRVKGYEVVRAIRLETNLNDQNQGFTIENDCLTPTFKLKRPQLRERYRAQIDEMYRELTAK